LRETSQRKLLAALTVTILALVLRTALAGPFTSNGTQPPLVYPLEPQSVCSGCHGGLDSGFNVRPWTTWSGSMMAHATRDPLFWAALDVANNDLPGAGDFCLRCHTPRGFLAGRTQPPLGTTDGCGLIGNIDEDDNDFAGVECSLCHRMTVNPSPPPGQQPVYYDNAQFWVDDEPCTPDFVPCNAGPYGYGPGWSEPPHAWVYSQYHVDADNCGNCHNVTNPVKTLVDENGVNTGIPMPVERTFKEWEQSDYSQAGPTFATCQGCHMPDALHDPAYASVYPFNNRTGDLPVHRFVGGNAWVPQVLAGEYPALGLASSFAATAAWATELLQAAATVEVTPTAVAAAGGDLDVVVRVTNLSGHKLPTGYPEGRRMWLDIVLRDSGGTVLWQSGAWDPATGVLAPDPQLHVYEVKPGIWNLNGTSACDTTGGSGNPLFHFVLNDCVALDNRIPPLGFTGGSDLETRPVAYSYPETSPGSGVLVNHDVVPYAIPIPSGLTGEVSVTATLRYQTASKEYVDFLLDESTTNQFPDDCIPRSQTGMPDMNRAEILHDVWTRYGRSAPVAMATATAPVELALFADDFESGGTGAWSGTVP